MVFKKMIEKKANKVKARKGICQVCGNAMNSLGILDNGSWIYRCWGGSDSCKTDYIVDKSEGTQVENRRTPL